MPSRLPASYLCESFRDRLVERCVEPTEHPTRFGREIPRFYLPRLSSKVQRAKQECRSRLTALSVFGAWSHATRFGGLGWRRSRRKDAQGEAPRLYRFATRFQPKGQREPTFLRTATGSTVIRRCPRKRARRRSVLDFVVNPDSVARQLPICRETDQVPHSTQSPVDASFDVKYRWHGRQT